MEIESKRNNKRKQHNNTTTTMTSSDPWDNELTAVVLSQFSAAVRESVKSYVLDPSKGVPFKIDGAFGDFPTIEMRFKDLCTEYSIERCRQGHLGARPPGPGGNAAAQRIWRNWSDIQDKIYAVTRSLMTDTQQRHYAKLAGPTQADNPRINAEEGMGYSMWRTLRQDLGGDTTRIKARKLTDLLKTNFDDQTNPYPTAQQFVIEARDIEPVLGDANILVMLLDLLPPAMQANYATELPNRRSNQPGLRDQPITLDEVLADLKLEAARNCWPWTKKTTHSPQQAMGVQSQSEQVSLRPQWQAPPPRDVPQPSHQDLVRAHGWAAPSAARPSADVDECWNCGGRGHRSFQCPTPRQDGQRSASTPKGGGGRALGGKAGGYGRPALHRGGKGGWRSQPAQALHRATQALATFNWSKDEDGTLWHEDSTYDEWITYLTGLHSSPDTVDEVTCQTSITGLASVQTDESDQNPWTAYARHHFGSTSVAKISSCKSENKPKQVMFDSFFHAITSFWTALNIGVESCMWLLFFSLGFLLIGPLVFPPNVAKGDLTMTPIDNLATPVTLDPTSNIASRLCPTYNSSNVESLSTIRDGTNLLRSHYACPSSYEQNDWEYHIMDSGASCPQHKHNAFTLADDVPTQCEVTVASGDSLFSTSSGVTCYEFEGGVTMDMSKSQSFCIPQLHHNLMSIIDMAKNGCKIQFEQFGDGTFCKAWNASGDELPVQVINNIPWLI